MAGDVEGLPRLIFLFSGDIPNKKNKMVVQVGVVESIKVILIYYHSRSTLTTPS